MLQGQSKDGWDRYAWNLVIDDKGAPLGHYRTPLQAVQAEVQIIKDFLISISKQKGTESAMSEKTTERTNMVFLAGLLKMDPRRNDKNTSALIDVGLKSSIQVSIYVPDGNKSQGELASKLMRFKQGDFIKLVAMLRPYGTRQDDGTWKNGISIDVTQIKSDPPQRSVTNSNDDDHPY